ncbi:unnamed protein product [Brachionus calyciflorus]|uniref:Uncharacterized protein n=1 Tax=Brachionus calyciflorus TaxID=104777 RepID=A0A813TXF4_9BILA|nr:unnamed protein product [Brachionus calyciflorus]
MNNTEKRQNVLTNIYQNLFVNYFERDDNKDSKALRKTTKNARKTSDKQDILDKAQSSKNSDEISDDNNSKIDQNIENLFNITSSSNNETYSNITYESIDCSKVNLSQNKDCSLSSNVTSSDFDSNQRKILISEKLLQTKRIWYLPYLDKSKLQERLINKPIGNFIVTGSLKPNSSKNKLILYKSSDKSKISEYIIDVDSKLNFSLKEDSSLKFKSIIFLLEYYIINDNRSSKKLKLTLPNAISQANNFKRLNSLSLLEQDFWLNEFYNKNNQLENTILNKQISLTDYKISIPESKSNSSSLPQINHNKLKITKQHQKKAQSLDQLEIPANSKTKTLALKTSTIKKRTSRKSQRVFYDPRFNSYPSATVNFNYSNLFKFFKISKSKSVNTTGSYEQNDKNSKISNLVRNLIDESKANEIKKNYKESSDQSLTNLSGTLSNSKSLHNFDCLSINSCLSFIDMIDTNKNLIETYSTIPVVNPMRTKSKLENRKTNILALLSSQTNEYSEPFDLISTKKDFDKNVYDDSAYSSCYQSNLSSPQCNKVKVILTEEENVNDSLESSCSSSAQLSNSEYESVKDILINSEKDLFKSTITAFDILTERCSELMELFDSDITTDSKKTLDLKRKLSKYQKNTINLHDSSKKAQTNFLNRNLNFDFYMKSSSLLSSSMNTQTDKFNSIRNLIIKMSKNDKIIFGKNIQEFVNCTLNLKELNPFLLMSNTRQFMNGIKNYLLKNDTSNIELRILLDKERAKLDHGEIINIDCLIEDCLQSIILQPLKAKIYYLMVDWFISDNSMISLKHNMKFINDLTSTEIMNYLKLDENCLLDERVLRQLRNYYNRMQCEYAPFIKLKYVLFIINEIVQYDSGMCDFEILDPRKLLSLIAYALSKCRMYAIQIEIEYIWSLINKSLISNETVYYLMLMSCACQALVGLNVQSIDLTSYLMEVLYPNERGSELKRGFIPVRNGVKCKDLIQLIAAKFKIYNQNEYCLYIYDEFGEFVKVKDDERLYDMQMDKIKSGERFQLVYKQKNSNILLCSNLK